MILVGSRELHRVITRNQKRYPPLVLVEKERRSGEYPIRWSCEETLDDEATKGVANEDGRAAENDSDQVSYVLRVRLQPHSDAESPVSTDAQQDRLLQESRSRLWWILSRVASSERA